MFRELIIYINKNDTVEWLEGSEPLAEEYRKALEAKFQNWNDDKYIVVEWGNTGDSGHKISGDDIKGVEEEKVEQDYYAICDQLASDWSWAETPKTLQVTYGTPGDRHVDNVQLRGVFRYEILTPKMAVQAARISPGHRDRVTVFDPDFRVGYRLYKKSHRKITDEEGE